MAHSWVDLNCSCCSPCCFVGFDLLQLDKKTVCYRQHSFCHMKCNNPGSTTLTGCALDTFTDT
jgi:hypothetical protein